MTIHIFKFGIISTILQLIIYWIVLQFTQLISSLLTNGESEFISDWAFVSIGIFGIMLLIQNIVTANSSSKKAHLISAYCVSGLILLTWCEDLSSEPYQTIFCMIVSVATVFSKFYIDKIFSCKLLQS